MEDWERYTLAGVALATPVVIAIIAAAVQAHQAAQQNVLMLTVSGQGTVDIPTGTHSYPGPTEVTVTATPATGYQTNWNLNGVDVEQGVDIYSVYVNGVVTLGVYFTPTGPPHGPIAGIRSVGTVGTLENLDYFLAGGGTGPLGVLEADENWVPGAQCAPALMQFKVYDAGGVGIPNIPVMIYPEANPDTTVFKAYAMLDSNPLLTGPFRGINYGVSNPLAVYTDSEGLVSFRIRNLYGAEGLFTDVSQATDGFGKQLSQSTGIHANKILDGLIMAPIEVLPIYKSLYAGLGYAWLNGGGGGTVQYNRNIRAEIINTAYYTIQPITVSFTSKWG
jgi:hypothetical protein